MMRDEVTRREMIKQMAALGVLAPMATIGSTTISIDDAAAIKASAAKNDVTIAIRNWFANQCPLLTRLPWVACEDPEFVMQPGNRRQLLQTFEMIARVDRSSPMPPVGLGIQTPFDFEATAQLQNLVNDIESALMFGLYRSPKADCGPAMAGLLSLISTNNKYRPLNADDYGPDDFVHDTVKSPTDTGGDPDLLVVSSNFMRAFAGWGWKVERVPAGETVFGTPISVFETMSLPGRSIIESPLLRPFTVIALASHEVVVRNRRNPHWKMKHSQGDRSEGSWIAELAIDLTNEHHHAAVSGIKRFAA